MSWMYVRRVREGRSLWGQCNKCGAGVWVGWGGVGVCYCCCFLPVLDQRGNGYASAGVSNWWCCRRVKHLAVGVDERAGTGGFFFHVPDLSGGDTRSSGCLVAHSFINTGRLREKFPVAMYKYLFEIWSDIS